MHDVVSKYSKKHFPISIRIVWPVCGSTRLTDHEMEGLLRFSGSKILKSHQAKRKSSLQLVATPFGACLEL